MGRKIPGTNGLETELPFTDNALEVISKRYLKKDPDGKTVRGENGRDYHLAIETPEEMFMRVAKTLAEVELSYGKTQEEVEAYTKEFYDVMSKMEYCPGGRTLANAGLRPVVNNCLVLHIPDSMEGICDTLSTAMQLQQLGVGLGFPLHMLRPAGSYCKRTQGEASGPCSFLHLYDTAFSIVKQQNRHDRCSRSLLFILHYNTRVLVSCVRTILFSTSSLSYRYTSSTLGRNYRRHNLYHCPLCLYHCIRL